MLSLSDLNLNHNRLASLAPLAHCRQLRRLFVSANRISSLAPLRHCALLETLCAAANVIASLGEAIGCLRPLPNLTELELAANPCTLGEPYRRVAGRRPRARGVADSARGRGGRGWRGRRGGWWWWA